MGMLTTTGRNGVLDHVLGKTAMTQPTSFTLRLSSTSIGSDGAYTQITAVPDITVSPSDFSAAASGSITTSSDIESDAATADGGTAVAVILIPNTGGATFRGELTTSKTITIGDPVRFKAGEITFSLTD